MTIASYSPNSLILNPDIFQMHVSPYISSSELLDFSESDFEQFEYLKDDSFWKKLYIEHFKNKGTYGANNIRNKEFKEEYKKTLEKLTDFFNHIWSNHEGYGFKFLLFFNNYHKRPSKPRLILPLTLNGNIDPIPFQSELLSIFFIDMVHYGFSHMVPLNNILAWLEKSDALQNRYHIEWAFFYAAKEDNIDILNWLKKNPKFDEISNEAISEAFIWAAKKTNIDTLNWLKESSKFDKISNDAISEAFIWAAKKTNIDTLNWLKESSKFDKISNDAISEAFIWAAKDMNINMLNWLKDKSNRFHEISSNTINIAFDFAIRKGHIKVFDWIKESQGCYKWKIIKNRYCLCE